MSTPRSGGQRYRLLLGTGAGVKHIADIENLIQIAQARLYNYSAT